MNNTYRSVVHFLQKNVQLNNLEIIPLDYNPALFYTIIASILTTIQMLLILFCFFSYRVYKLYAAYFTCSNPTITTATRRPGQSNTAEGIEEDNYPEFIKVVDRNKWTFVLIIFFGMNIVKQLLTATNAFELFLGEELIWSTIENKKLPSAAELLSNLSNAGLRVNH